MASHHAMTLASVNSRILSGIVASTCALEACVAAVRDSKSEQPAAVATWMQAWGSHLPDSSCLLPESLLGTHVG